MADNTIKGGSSWAPPIASKSVRKIDRDIITSCRSELLCARKNHQLDLDELAMQELKGVVIKLNGFIEGGGFK